MLSGIYKIFSNTPKIKLGPQIRKVMKDFNEKSAWNHSKLLLKNVWVIKKMRSYKEIATDLENFQQRSKHVFKNSFSALAFRKYV